MPAVARICLLLSLLCGVCVCVSVRLCGGAAMGAAISPRRSFSCLRFVCILISCRMCGQLMRHIDSCAVYRHQVGDHACIRWLNAFVVSVSPDVFHVGFVGPCPSLCACLFYLPVFALLCGVVQGSTVVRRLVDLAARTSSYRFLPALRSQIHILPQMCFVWSVPFCFMFITRLPCRVKP